MGLKYFLEEFISFSLGIIKEHFLNKNNVPTPTE